MSKFIDAIKVEMTGRQLADMSIPSLLKVEDGVQRVDDYSTLIEYRIHVTYGSIVHCRLEDLGKAKENIVQSLREEVFGDARKKAFEFQRAFYSGDRHQISERLDDLMREILG